MNNYNTIFDELNQLSPMLAAVDKRMHYQVPSQYFDDLPQAINSQIWISSLSTKHKRNLYSIPKGYFETFPQRLLDSLRRNNAIEVFEEIEAIAPLLNTISKQPLLSVPSNYFKQKGDTILPNVSKSKILSLSNPFVWGVSIAAIFCSVLFLQPFMLFHPTKSINVNKEIAHLSNQDLLQEIDNTNTLNSINDSNETATDLILPDVQTSIKYMSDDELKEFLKDNSDDVEQKSKGS